MWKYSACVGFLILWIVTRGSHSSVCARTVADETRVLDVCHYLSSSLTKPNYYREFQPSGPKWLSIKFLILEFQSFNKKSFHNLTSTTTWSFLPCTLQLIQVTRTTWVILLQVKWKFPYIRPFVIRRRLHHIRAPDYIGNSSSAGCARSCAYRKYDYLPYITL
jgi:hypothetical protein